MIGIKSKFSTLRLTKVAILSSIAIVFSVLESLLPSGALLVPGGKLGLSNAVSMYALFDMGLLQAIGISVTKSLMVGVTRGFTAFIMSLTGGILSTLAVNVFIRRYKDILFIKGRGISVTIVGVSIIGAVIHNLSQIGVASIVLSVSFFYYLPCALILSLCTGYVTGVSLRLMFPFVRKAGNVFINNNMM